VVLFEPLPVARDGIGLLISEQPDLEVLAQAGSAREALGAIRQVGRRPGVVVLVARRAPGVDEAALFIQAVRRRHPHLPIVVYGPMPDMATLAELDRMAVSGFVHERADPVVFLDTVRQASRRRSRSAANDRGPRARTRLLGSLLSLRELEVLRLVADGLTARQVARRLSIRERTVTTHLSHLYHKLGVSRRTDAVRVARDMRMIE